MNQSIVIDNTITPLIHSGVRCRSPYSEMETLLFSFSFSKSFLCSGETSSPMNPNEFDNCKVIVPLFCEVPVLVGPCIYNGAKLWYIKMG